METTVKENSVVSLRQSPFFRRSDVEKECEGLDTCLDLTISQTTIVGEQTL